MRPSSTDAVGPNAIIQTGAALRDLFGRLTEHDIFQRAGLIAYLEHPPAAMIRQREAAALFAALRGALQGDQADDVLAEAGRRTARYIITHRIPRPVKMLIAALPESPAARILLAAILKHSWTFAGTGAVHVSRKSNLSLSIADNPLATPGCPWHSATIQELFQVLVSRRIAVRHTSCCAKGDSHCHFAIQTGFAIQRS